MSYGFSDLPLPSPAPRIGGRSSNVLALLALAVLAALTLLSGGASNKLHELKTVSTGVSESLRSSLRSWAAPNRSTALSRARNRHIYRPLIAPGYASVSPTSADSRSYPLSRYLADRLEHRNFVRPDKLWLAVADGEYASQALEHLTRLLGRLNHQHRLFSKTRAQKHDLLVACLDEECLEVCTDRGWLCYGGYVKEEYPQSYGSTGKAKVQWVKTRAMHDVLEAGYAVLFVDADVFFRKDPFDMLKPLSDKSWDVQIQDESHNGQVNIGLIYMRSTPITAWVWGDIAKRLKTAGGWDQDHFNAIMDTVERRKGGQLSIVTPDGLKLDVLHPTKAWGFHFGWLYPEETYLLHMTCCGTDLADKLYIAGTYGALAGAQHYLEPPSGILTVSGIAGTRAEIALTMRMLMAASQASGRAFLPPLIGSVLGFTDIEDGIVRGNISSVSVDSRGDLPDPDGDELELHRRFFWNLIKPSVFKQYWTDVTLLEPNYIDHATLALLDIEDVQTAKELHSVAELDLRPIFTFEMLVKRLADPIFAKARIVRIATDEGPRGFWSRFAKWELPETAPRIAACYDVEKMPACSSFCRQPPDGWLLR